MLMEFIGACSKEKGVHVVHSLLLRLIQKCQSHYALHPWRAQYIHRHMDTCTSLHGSHGTPDRFRVDLGKSLEPSSVGC